MSILISSCEVTRLAASITNYYAIKNSGLTVPDASYLFENW
jgi:hypothetical protein